MTPIRAAESRTDTETSFGEVQSIARGSADSVVRNPAHILLTHASLKHEIFDQTSNGIIRKSSDDGGVHSEAPLQAAGNVVFASTFPRTELARCRNPLIAGIEPEHDFAKAHQVPHALAFWFDVQSRHDFIYSRV